MYIVVRHIVNDVSHSSVCAHRFSGRRPVTTTKHMYRVSEAGASATAVNCAAMG